MQHCPRHHNGRESNNKHKSGCDIRMYGTIKHKGDRGLSLT